MFLNNFHMSNIQDLVEKISGTMDLFDFPLFCIDFPLHCLDDQILDIAHLKIVQNIENSKILIWIFMKAEEIP